MGNKSNWEILLIEFERIKAETERVPFGTVGFSVVLHGGQIRRTTRRVETSEQSPPSG